MPTVRFRCLGFADCRRGTGMCLLCRRTALHCASQNGHTEIAMALVKAGADVHCNGNDGYGSALGLPPSLFGLSQCEGGRSFV